VFPDSYTSDSYITDSFASNSSNHHQHHQLQHQRSSNNNNHPVGGERNSTAVTAVDAHTNISNIPPSLPPHMISSNNRSSTSNTSSSNSSSSTSSSSSSNDGKQVKSLRRRYFFFFLLLLLTIISLRQLYIRYINALPHSLIAIVIFTAYHLKSSVYSVVIIVELLLFYLYAHRMLGYVVGCYLRWKLDPQSTGETMDSSSSSSCIHVL